MNNFIKTLDRSEIGIVGKMTQLNSILRQKDPQLWQDMVRILNSITRVLN
jgi:hypothetical protein